MAPLFVSGSSHSLPVVTVRAVLGVLLVFLTACDPAATTSNSLPEASLETEVTRIVDGDTLYVADLDERVRLIGIDTPEVDPSPECYGPESSAHLAELAPVGSDVVVVFDVERQDQYGRNLAYVYVGDDLVNEEMVADGYARVYTFPPNTAHVETLEAAERAARDSGLGMWGACG